MILHDTIRDLATFHSSGNCAISFYYQPQTPQDKSHRSEAIQAKDLLRTAMRNAERDGANGNARADFERIMEIAEHLHGNHARGKAIFACGSQNFWREFDLPPRLGESRVFVGRRFHIRPLAFLGETLSRFCAVVLDRTRARFFELELDEVLEGEPMSHHLPRRGRSDGWRGFDAGHAERHVDHEAMHFLKQVADRLLERQESGVERFLIGCREELWPEIEPHLHPYVTQRLVGRFHLDPSLVTPEEIRGIADQAMSKHAATRRRELVREATGQAKRDSRGALGVGRVLLALETGEAQSILLANTFASPGVQCANCGHLEAESKSECALCRRPVTELEDISDALIWQAMQRGVEVVAVSDEPELSELTHAGGLAALLRFRADQNTEQRKAG
ncbi:MAG: hypothetical protein AB7O65_01965 [Candidatus Korobacteraceae bacterium]